MPLTGERHVGDNRRRDLWRAARPETQCLLLDYWGAFS